MSDEYTITVHDSARETIARMQNRVDQLGIHFGQQSEPHVKAQKSLIKALTTLFGYGEIRVWRDGPADTSLSLGGCTSWGLAFGLVFHRQHRHCTDVGCKAYANDDGSIFTFSGHREDALDHEHIWSYALTAPAPGEWSYHS